MAGMLRVHRRRGALSGVLLVLLGAWGGLVPLIGPYFHYAYTPDRAWSVTAGRFWLEIAPAVVVLAGGFVVLRSRIRPVALVAAALAALSGAWLVFGSALVRLWTTALPAQGAPVGGPVARAAEQIGLFAGLGAVIICVASAALGRLSVVSRMDLKAAEPISTTGTSAAPPAAPVSAAAATSSTATASIWRKVASSGRKAGTSGSGTPASGTSGGAEAPARDGVEPVGSGTARA